MLVSSNGRGLGRNLLVGEEALEVFHLQLADDAILFTSLHKKYFPNIITF